ncbi:hypothetical protein DFA_02303 [Cavenderia fasciculata]|uniref:Uncharacterized protein n=1 Tax=Cavenderia fasciculata TaxID=261658 RepID=F4PZ30_CACFS|nr:uncharacterized protein DFA_02303 [Cavenderia fasciculata]EGG19059.1 hypothetical protein DFA_02303 [Cavenderia fasciculata]|eukprot:XP_004366692.1 hypothetical protein DFA_02303 [Cavenderia fasciculata]
MNTNTNNIYLLSLKDIEELTNICKDLNISIPKPRNRTTLRSCIAARLKEKEWYQSAIVDDNPLNKYHRGTVDYALPWILVSSILKHAYNLSGQCNCHCNSFTSTPTTSCLIHYRGSGKIYDSERWPIGSSSSSSSSKLYTAWRIDICLISKQVYQYVSNHLFDRLTIRGMEQSNNLWQSVSKQWSIVKRLKRLSVNTHGLDDILDDSHLAQQTYRELTRFKSITNSFTLAHLNKMARLMPNLTSIAITMQSCISKTMTNLLFQNDSVLINLVDIEFGTGTTLPFTNFSKITRKRIRKLVISYDRINEMLKTLPLHIKQQLEVTSATFSCVPLLQDYPKIHSLYLKRELPYYQQYIPDPNQCKWPIALDTVYCSDMSSWGHYLKTIPTLKCYKDHYTYIIDEYHSKLSTIENLSLPLLEQITLNIPPTKIHTLSSSPNFKIQSTKFVDNPNNNNLVFYRIKLIKK